MSKRLTIVFIFLISITILRSQSKTDSLRTILRNATDDSTKAYTYLTLASNYTLNNPKLTLRYCDTIERYFSHHISDSISITKLQYYRGTAHVKLNNFDQVEQHLAIARADFLSLADSTNYAKTLFQYGDYYRRQSKWDQALSETILAQKVFEAIGNRQGSANCNNSIGLVYKNTGLPDKAIESYGKALSIYRKLNHTVGISTCLLNMGNLSNKLKRYDDGIEYFDEAKTIAQASPSNSNLMSYILSSLGTAYFEIGQKKKSLLLYDEAYELRKKVGKPDELVNSLINLGKVAIDLNRINKADQYVSQALPLSTPSNYVEQIAIVKLQDLIAQKQNNIQRSNDLKNTIISLKDSISKKDIRQEVLEVTTKYETELKEQQIALLDSQNEAQQSALQASAYRNYGLLVGLGLISIFSLFLYRQGRKIKTQNTIISKALNDKDILLREIHHRVKNNLQFISSLLNLQSRHIKDQIALSALKEGQNRVKSMALIHQNLYQEDNLTGIEVKTYFEKLIDNLFNSYNISPDRIGLSLSIQNLSLDVDTVIPIGLIVNELISNSLKHAFPEPRKGMITVILIEENDKLLLTVADDGIGFSQNIDELKSSSFGYKMIHSFAIQLEAELHIKTTDGTSASLIIADYNLAS